MDSKETPPARRKVNQPSRGDIFLVCFDPSVGSEIRKTRPAIVLQNDVANRHSPITIVAAISTKFDEPPYPTDVILEPEDSGLNLRSAAVLNQIRSVDRRRLLKRIGRATPACMERINRAIEISLGLLLL